MNTNSKIEQIKDVAIYLRKSRGEEEDLQKHRDELIELCKNNGWRYVEYIEIGSSADIEFRPALQKLLEDIKDDMYDAVVVIDKDRLSREGTGQALINKTLIDNDCLIVTPHKIYDLSNDNDILMSEVEDLMARFEYRMISKRFRRGKRRGAKQGHWVNGTPPFPYVYDPNRKGLVVDESKGKWYRFMVEKFLEGKPFYEIAWELNNLGIRTNKGSVWHENSIRRLLLSEVHLGHIIYNKTEGSRHKKKKTKPLKVKPKDEWIVVKNCHEALKTEEEHKQIFALLSKRRRVPVTSRQIKLPLSGIVKCGICGKTMQVVKKELVSKTAIYIKTCNKADPFGNRCKNKGGDGEIVIKYIHERIRKRHEELKEEIENNENNFSKNIEYYQLKTDGINQELRKKEEAIERIDLAYEEGIYSLEKYKSRIEVIKKEIEKLKNEKKAYEIEIEQLMNKDKKQEYEQLTNILKELNSNLSWKELNELYRRNGIEVYWIKNEAKDKPTIDINFTK